MKVLIIGGDRHGEFVELPDGAQSWVDLAHGDTYRIAGMRWGVTDPGPDGTPVVTERYKLRLAIHPRIQADPAAMAIADEGVKILAVTEFMRAHAEALEPDVLPSAPDTPAPLFGPDGRVL